MKKRIKKLEKEVEDLKRRINTQPVFGYLPQPPVPPTYPQHPQHPEYMPPDTITWCTNN